MTRLSNKSGNRQRKLFSSTTTSTSRLLPGAKELFVIAGIGLLNGVAAAENADSPPTTSTAAPADSTATTMKAISVKAKADSDKDSVRAVTSTITKDNQELRDIPQTITVINRAVLDAQGASSLPDALRNVPGITIGGAEGGQIGNNINLRGFTARTDIYLDGMRDRGQYYRDTFFLESVEVLKGPSSMLFGRGSTGGIINQVSKRPEFTDKNEVSAMTDSEGTVRGTLDINHPFSNTAALRVSMMGQDFKSTRDVMQNRDYGIAPSLKLFNGEPTEVTVSALVERNHDMPDYGVPAVNGQPANISYDNFYGLKDDRTVQNVNTISALVEHKFSSKINFRNQTQYSDYTTDAHETGASRVGTFVNGAFTGLTTNTVGNTTTLPYTQLYVLLGSHDRNIVDKSLYNQTDLSVKFTTGAVRHNLLSGIELGHDEYNNQAYSRTNPAITGITGVAVLALQDPAVLSTPAGVVTTTGNLVNSTANSIAGYVNDTVELNQWFKVVGGLRWDRFAASIHNSINSANTTGNTTLPYASQTVDFTSVRAGVIYQPADEQSYYLSYGTSFDPSLETLTLTTGQQNLAPEKNKSYEAGGKWDVLQDNLSLAAAVFRTEKENARSLISTGVYELDGNVRVDGAEASVAGHLTTNWQMLAGYTYLDGRVVEASALDGTQGKILANTPRNNATLWSTYNLTKEWELGGGATYMSSRFASNTDVVTAGGFTRCDLTAAWHQPKYDVRLNVYNVGDIHYIAALIPSDGGRAVPGFGRTEQLTFNYRF